MFNSIIEFIQKLDLAHPKHVFGLYFHEIIALLAIIFGGAFLLFAGKHFDYYRGIVGFLLGAWIGIFLKEKVFVDTNVSAVVYIIGSAILFGALFLFFKRVVGLLLGSLVMMVFISVFIPSVIDSSNNKYFMMVVLALLGGTLGALFPQAIFIVVSSVIGATFITYGATLLISQHFIKDLPSSTQVLLHLGIFLPLVIFGALYQFMSAPKEPQPDPSAAKTEA